jgi:hypothetical protein
MNSKILKSSDGNFAELDILKKYETKEAYLFSDGDKDVWIPKSKIESIETLHKNIVRIVIPEWLANEKELI